MPKKGHTSRRIRPAADAKLQIGSAEIKLQWATRLKQVGPIQWNGAKGRVQARLEFYNFWMRRVLPLDKVLLPVPSGTEGAGTPGGTPLVVVVDKMAGKVIGRKGAHLQVELPISRGGGTVQVWIPKQRLAFGAAAQKVAPAWLKPGGRARGLGKKGRCKLELWTKPNPDPISDAAFADLLLCELSERLPRVRIIKRKGDWVRLWYRLGASGSIVVTGWIERADVKRIRRCSCSYHSAHNGRRGMAFMPFQHSETMYTTARALPLYQSPDRKTLPLGVLHKGGLRFRGKPKPRAGSSFLPVGLIEQPFAKITLYVPYRPTFFKPLPPDPRPR